MPVCAETGSASLSAQAAALCVFVAAETCDECGGALDDDAEGRDALTIRGACAEGQRRTAWIARQAAVAANHAATVREASQIAA
jgi:hypothetical protein